MIGILLLRGIPIPGESLSSFRQRIWMINGHNLFPVFPPELRRSDPDLQRSGDVYDIVAHRLDISIEAVRSLTLWSHPLLANTANTGESKQHVNPRWVIPLRYGSIGKGVGSLLCPLCLREGRTIYFRRVWRFSIFLTCPEHGCQLIECCPNCGMPPWPHGATSLSTLFRDQINLDECLRCRLKLSEISVEEEKYKDVVDCSSAIAAGVRVTGWGPIEASLSEQLAALRALMHLALSIRPVIQAKLGRTKAFDLVMELRENSSKSISTFDRVNAKMRRLLLLAACPLLKGWPNQFLEFSERTAISLTDFSEAWTDLPLWMRSILSRKVS
jgi:hypothetical protein